MGNDSYFKRHFEVLKCIFLKKTWPGGEESDSYSLCKAWSSLGQKGENERAIRARKISLTCTLPCTLFCHVVLKRFTIGQHVLHLELCKQQFCWPSGGLSKFRSFGPEYTSVYWLSVS